MKKITFGTDALSRRGTRAGVEFSLASRSDDVMLQLNVFVVLGKPR